MREILFRGKTISGGWVQGLLANNDDKWYISNKVGAPFAYEIYPETICQYTGLTDKNGKKIFEGDIVTVPNDDELYSVVWDEDTAAWSLSAEAVVYNFDNFWGYELEVVSNVYDNPEWLEA